VIKSGEKTVSNAVGEAIYTAVAERPAGARPRVYNIEGNAALKMPAEAWKLSALLQTSLDINKVIEIFARELGARVPVDGFIYRHSEKELTIALGQPARHSANYRLLLEERPLGEITVTRASRFNNGEIVTIENLIGGLVYALRNALLYQEALQSALKDPLTGIANRTALEAALRREISLSRRHKLPLSLLLFDIDKFKRINDTHGHAAGDAVLLGLTRAVATCVRGTDVLARMGGEEFVVVLPGTDRSGALLLAARICAHIGGLRITAPNAETLGFTVSIGVSTCDAGDDYASLMDRADRAMYSAKQNGGNQVAFG